MRLKETIESAWHDLENGQNTLTDVTKEAVIEIINQLDAGILRVSEKIDGEWKVNQFIKQAILLFFKMHNNELIKNGEHSLGYDKIPLKCFNWSNDQFASSEFRMVPGAIIRKGAYVSKKVILMPSFVNIGAYIDEGSMIDTWATVGSCAQIGKNCHISGGSGIGGVLEPIQASPVIIEDDVFIGARSEIAEGVIVKRGAVISMGVYIGASTRIYNRSTGEITYGVVPEYSVVVPGTLPSSDGKTQTYAAIIVKSVDASTRSKTNLNELLRES